MKPFFFTLLALTVFVSCTKDKTKGGLGTCQLSEVVDAKQRKLNTYEYDAEGRIKTIRSYDITGKVLWLDNFEYGTNSVTRKHESYGNVETYIYELDENKRATRRVWSSNGSVLDTAYMQYDDAGMLLQTQHLYIPSFSYDTVLFVNDNGQRLSATKDSNTFNKIKYEYCDFKDELNVIALINVNSALYGDRFDKELFLGRSSEWAIKTISSSNKSDIAHTIDYDHIYELNKKGHISSIRLTIRYKYSYDLYKDQIWLHYANCGDQ